MRLFFAFVKKIEDKVRDCFHPTDIEGEGFNKSYECTLKVTLLAAFLLKLLVIVKNILLGFNEFLIVDFPFLVVILFCFFLLKRRSSYVPTVMIVTIIFSFTYYLLKGYLYVLFWYSLIPLIAGIFYDVRKTIYASLIPLVVNTLIFPLVEFNKFGFKGSEAEGILLISVESLLSYFAFTIAVVIYRSFLDNYQKVVESLVERDSLTGAFSRRKLFKILEERFRVSLEKAEPLSLLMLDIDRFKKVNDTYGHQVGDLVLKKLVEVVKKSVRSSDVVGRYGGEEFLIVLPNTQLGDALKVAEKIRKNVENTNFPVVGEVTISIGVTAGDRNTLRNKNLDSLIQEADDALYLAKKRGRNRVETVLELVRV